MRTTWPLLAGLLAATSAAPMRGSRADRTPSSSSYQVVSLDSSGPASASPSPSPSPSPSTSTSPSPTPTATPPIPPDASTIPWTNATAFDALRLARVAYCPPAEVGSWTCAACGWATVDVHEIIDHSLSDSFAFVGYDATAERIVVVFRGSSNIANWIFDADVARGGLEPMIPDVHGVEVHLGFRDSIVELKEDLIHGVKTLLAIHPGSDIIVVGHSLGAAQATLAALVFTVELGLSTTVFNFGSPRIGNERFYDYLRSLGPKRIAVWRSVNERDIVPHLPPKDVGYHHLSTEVWRENATDWHTPGTPTECVGGEDTLCSNSLGVSIDLFAGIKAHEHYFSVPTCDCSAWPRGLGPGRT